MLPETRKTRAIFWDNDGVLVDTEHLYFQATQEVLASVDIALTRDDYIQLFLVEGRGAWHLAQERGVPADLVERLRVPFDKAVTDWERRRYFERI